MDLNRCPALALHDEPSETSDEVLDASADGSHQVPPQPPQFASLLLQYPDAQPPVQLLDHLQQLGAGDGVVGTGAGVGCGVGAGVSCAVVVGGAGGAGVGGGVGGAGVGGRVEAGASTLKSKHEMKVSGFLVHAFKFGLFHNSFSSFRKVSVCRPTLL